MTPPVEGNTNRHCVNVKVRRETEKAWLVDDGSQEVWMPKSQCELYLREDDTCDLFAEEWILKAKGMI